MSVEVLDSFGRIKEAISSPLPISGICEARLTTESLVPISTSDRTDQATIYWTPYAGNMVALYQTGIGWNLFPIAAEQSFSVPATNGTPYDVWGFYDGTKPALETLIWTNATTRATALSTQDGVLIKSGSPTRRYLGTFYPNANSKVQDTVRLRHLYNYYNRIPRPLRVFEATDSWTYTTDSFRQANASSTNQVEVCVGFLGESMIDLAATGITTSTSATNVLVSTSIGEDSTTASVAGCMIHAAAVNTNIIGVSSAYARIYPSAIGFHFYAWLERSQASGTTTWYGDNGGTALQTGLIGTWWC